ncbi:hypothetical protein EV714DRAFT_286211 [Schizophyllum commune]
MLSTSGIHRKPRCPISGATENLRACHLIPLKTADKDGLEVARMEWVFGLPRGGLWYYLKSAENTLHLRGDVFEMYQRGDFVLAPTFQGYLEVMSFMGAAGVKDRAENDRSPRRPLTALASDTGLYRYVLIPHTNAARALQDSFKLQPQTTDDLNGGFLPYDNQPCLPESKDLPIVECHAHPYSIAIFADKKLNRRSTILSGQWHAICGEIIDQWQLYTSITVPQWFVEDASYRWDDATLPATEATGYDPLESESEDALAKDPLAIERDPTIDDADYRKKVCAWVSTIDPKAAPSRQGQRSPVRERHSRRLQEMRGLSPRPPCESEPPLSPVRRGPLRPRDPIRNPPAWALNGRFPTRRFTSNDWAFFRYRVALASAMKAPPSRKRRSRAS